MNELNDHVQRSTPSLPPQIQSPESLCSRPQICQFDPIIYLN